MAAAATANSLAPGKQARGTASVARGLLKCVAHSVHVSLDVRSAITERVPPLPRQKANVRCA